MDGWSQEEMKQYIDDHKITPKLRQEGFYRYPSVQPDVQDLPGHEDAKNTVYLRPETAQVFL